MKIEVFESSCCKSSDVYGATCIGDILDLVDKYREALDVVLAATVAGASELKSY